jgi:hypothetical protein
VEHQGRPDAQDEPYDVPRPVTPDPVRAARLHRRARVLRWTAALALVLTVGSLRLAGQTDFLVLGDVVPRAWHLTLLLVVAGTACAVAGAWTGFAADDAGGPRGSTRWFVRWPVNLAKGVLLAVAWLTAAVAFLLGASSPVRVLDPPSPQGCRVVVREGFAGGGAVLVAPPGSVRAHEVGWYGSDIGPSPVAAGRYDLTWSRETGRFVVRGTARDPVWQSDPTVDCRPAGG